MAVTIEPVKEAKKKTLSVNQKLDVGYCIPNWLRDEQIKVNIGKCKNRIKEVTELIDEPIALVNYGPSLLDTWEEIKKFKYVMSCSGAHKFLVQRGIIPTWHIDVDPREHKIGLIGQPQKETEYLIASACSPKLFDYLEGYNVKLWHIFDTTDDGFRSLPYGEWAITGGCSAGVRTLTLARFLGFKNQHVFGMDGCISEEGTHAGPHQNSPKDFSILKYEGKEYKTTPAMLEAAKNVWHELNMMKDVTATFYGSGLVQDMAKTFVRKEQPKDSFIAFAKPELISPEYRAMNIQMHEKYLEFGVSGNRHVKVVMSIADSLKSKYVSILDYGCGKGYLAKSLPFPIAEYDPAIPGKDESPRPADLVVCTDVLEHIEPDRLDYVLDDLRRCVKNVGYFVISTREAAKKLPDGRNTHLNVHNRDWWEEKLRQGFKVGKIVEKKEEIYVLVGVKK